VKEMETDNRLKLHCFILDFSIWDDTIHDFVEKFQEKFNVYPNILLASDSTYRKIDLYAQKHPDRLINIEDMGTLETSSNPYEGLAYFSTEDYSLELCLDYDLQEGYFTLIFDEDPDFSGEPVIEENKEQTSRIYQFKRSA
jgi:hypothetical protein